MMRRVVSLRIEQYGKYQFSVLKGSPESLYIIHKFVTPRYKWRGQSQPSVLNSKGSIDSIKTSEQILEFEALFEKPAGTE